MSMSGARRVVLWRVDAPAGVVRAVAVAGGALPNAHVVHGSAITWVARERVSARLDPAPVWALTQRVIGIPVLEEPAAHALTFELGDDVEVNPGQFDALGVHVGALLNVLQDHIVLADYQERAEHLLDALRALPAATSEDVLARKLVDVAMNITHGTGASLASWDGKHLTIILNEGGGVAANRVVDEQDSMSVLAARSHATIVREGAALGTLSVVAAGERFLPSPDIAIAVPLITHGNVVGVLTAWAVTRVPQTSITALETLAPYAAAQLASAKELVQMRTLAERDGLTGLHNRRAFDQHLNAETARFDRYRRPYALVMMDIDHFKKINDQYGHDAGDSVLRDVARCITTSLRDVDVAARFGGEEFALLLPETDKSHAVVIAERIRARVEAARFEWRGAVIPVTLSAGIAAIPEHDARPEDIVREADQLLYAAKRQGRNRVVHKP